MKHLAMNGYSLGGDAMCDLELAKPRSRRGRQSRVLSARRSGPGSNAEGRKSNRVQEAFSTDPLSYSAPLYDGVNIVAAAMKRANSVEPSQFRNALAGIDLQGVASHYQFDKNRDLRDSPITVYTYQQGAPTPLAEVHS